jgi:hypothetical protein
VTGGVTGDAGAETDGGPETGRPRGSGCDGDGASGSDAGTDPSESGGVDGGFRPAIGPGKRGDDTDGRDGRERN